MKKKLIVPVVLCLAWTSFVLGEVQGAGESIAKAEVVVEGTVVDDTAITATESSLALFADGQFDPTLTGPIVDHMRATLLCEVVLLDGHQADVSGSRENMIDAVSGLVGNHQGVVALAHLPEDATAHGTFVQAKRVALLNVRGLTGDGGQKQLLSRLKKEEFMLVDCCWVSRLVRTPIV